MGTADQCGIGGRSGVAWFVAGGHDLAMNAHTRVALPGSPGGTPVLTGTQLEALGSVRDLARRDRAAAGRAPDDYIEAQVHGPVRLAEDVEAIVADPSFRCTRVGLLLEALADRFGFELSWHPGFELAADGVPAEFRGPEVQKLARRVAADFGDGSGLIDAEVVGRAARSVVTDPVRWAVHGGQAETLQLLEQLWHVLIAYGEPVGDRTGE